MADPSLPRRIDPTPLDCYLDMARARRLCMRRAAASCRPPMHCCSSRAGRIAFGATGAATTESHTDCDETGLVTELEALLEDAVRRQLVADVPVGVLLAVESTPAWSRRWRRAPRTRPHLYRPLSRGRRLRRDAACEVDCAALGTEHAELAVERPSAEIMPLLARQFDEPIADSSMVPTYLICRAVRQHCKVALGGDGGDELFGGYRHYSRMLWMQEHVGRFRARCAGRSPARPTPYCRWVSAAAAGWRRSRGPRPTYR